MGDLLNFDEATWDDVMAVNVKAMFLMCKAVIPYMLTQGQWLASSTPRR